MERKLNEIKEIVAEIIELEVDEISNVGSLKNDYGVDSMRMIEILATLEKNYAIKIPQDDLVQVDTVEDVYNIVKKHAQWD